MAEWFPWYPSLFEADTMHLTLEQDAIYRRLIDHYMKTRLPLPDSDVALARIAGADLACFEHASSIVRAFFKHKNGKLFHKFCDEQLDIQDKRVKNRSEISKRAAAKRWKESKPDQEDKCIEHASDDAKQDATGQDNTKKEDVVVSAREYVEIGKEISKITGWENDPRWSGDFGRIEQWLANGWTRDDILKTVTRIMGARSGPPRSVKYFEQAIADAHAARIKPLPEGKAHAENRRNHHGSNGKSQAVRDIIAEELAREYGPENSLDTGPIALPEF